MRLSHGCNSSDEKENDLCAYRFSVVIFSNRMAPREAAVPSGCNQFSLPWASQPSPRSRFLREPQSHDSQAKRYATKCRCRYSKSERGGRMGRPHFTCRRTQGIPAWKASPPRQTRAQLLDRGAQRCPPVHRGRRRAEALPGRGPRQSPRASCKMSTRLRSRMARPASMISLQPASASSAGCMSASAARNKSASVRS